MIMTVAKRGYLLFIIGKTGSFWRGMTANFLHNRGVIEGTRLGWICPA
jgi:hypothetical protein